MTAVIAVNVTDTRAPAFSGPAGLSLIAPRTEVAMCLHHLYIYTPEPVFIYPWLPVSSRGTHTAAQCRSLRLPVSDLLSSSAHGL